MQITEETIKQHGQQLGVVVSNCIRERLASELKTDTVSFGNHMWIITFQTFMHKAGILRTGYMHATVGYVVAKCFFTLICDYILCCSLNLWFYCHHNNLYCRRCTCRQHTRKVFMLPARCSRALTLTINSGVCEWYSSTPIPCQYPHSPPRKWKD